jgi:hypothetical protein
MQRDAPEYLVLDGLGNLFEAEEQLGKFKLKKFKKLLKPSVLSLGKKGKKGKQARKRFLVSGGLLGLPHFGCIPEPRPAFVLDGYLYGDCGTQNLDGLGKLKLFKKLKKVHKKVTKGVKKVVKSPAFKKLAVVGGIVAGSMFLGPGAAALVKKGAVMLGKTALKKKQAAQTETAYEGEIVPTGDPEPGTAARVMTGITDLLSTVAATRAMREGAIPSPPTSLASPEYREWATSAGVSAMEIDAQRRLTAQERAYAEPRIRSEVEALQEQITGRPVTSNQNMLMIGGAVLLGVVLLTQGLRPRKQS